MKYMTTKRCILCFVQYVTYKKAIQHLCYAASLCFNLRIRGGFLAKNPPEWADMKNPPS